MKGNNTNRLPNMSNLSEHRKKLNSEFELTLDELKSSRHFNPDAEE